MEKNVIITGVSSGIGRATLDILLGKGYHVFGSVRNQADADEHENLPRSIYATAI